MAVPKLPKNSFHKKWAGLSKSPALLFPAPRHAPAPCVHCSGQMLPHHRPRTAAMTFRVMPLCARPPCHLHRPTCREMCAADADEVCLPRPERGHPLFPLPPGLLLCWMCALLPSAPAVPRPSTGGGTELPLTVRHRSPRPSAVRRALRAHRKYTARRASPCKHRLCS